MSEARALLDEIGELIDPQDMGQMHDALHRLEALLDAYMAKLGATPEA